MSARRVFPALALALAAALAFTGCQVRFSATTTPAPSATQAIAALLETQAAAWNRGDIEGFMQAYAQRDDLRFASGDTVTYGWRATLARYRAHYPDRATMGTLTFSDLTITELSTDAAIVFGRWQLTRAADQPHGRFTLTLRRTPAGWRIIQDHTSAAAP